MTEPVGRMIILNKQTAVTHLSPDLDNNIMRRRSAQHVMISRSDQASYITIHLGVGDTILIKVTP